MFSMEQMQKMVWSQFAKASEQWPPEFREAMRNVEVDVVLRDGQIRIVGKLAEDNENTRKARQALLSTIMEPISQVVGAFQCKVTLYK